MELRVLRASGAAASVPGDSSRALAELPFRCRDRIVNAGDFRPGEYLGAEKTHGTAAVEDVHAFTNLQIMYNLTVAELHTYYVVVDGVAVLVHDAGCLNLPAQGPLGKQITEVVNHFDKTGKTPAGVMQGGARGWAKGVFKNRDKVLPKRKLGYWTETDVWATGGVKRGTERLVFGRRGEVYYTSDHYETVWRVR